MEYPVLGKSGLISITDTTAQYFILPPGGFAAGAKLQIVSSSSLLGKIAITSDRTIGQSGKLPSDSSITYTNVISVTSAGTAVAANADITCVAGQSVLIPVSGITCIRFTPSSGTGSIELIEEWSNDELIAARITQLIAAGITIGSLPAGSNLIGEVIGFSETGSLYNGTTALTPKFAKIAASSSGNNALVAAVTSKKIRVITYNLIANGTVNAKFQSDGGGTPVDLTGLKYLVANSGISCPESIHGYFESASGKSLDLNLSGAVAVGGELTYVEV